MRWSIDTILALRDRVARNAGVSRYEAYPVIRLKDRGLVGVYVRGRGWIRA